jgi:hypothetical protein
MMSGERVVMSTFLPLEGYVIGSGRIGSTWECKRGYRTNDILGQRVPIEACILELVIQFNPTKLLHAGFVAR